MEVAIKPDTPHLTFAVKTQGVRYGDNRTFFEYRIVMMHKGTLAGIEDGPRRSAPDRPAAAKAARQRIKFLRSRRLFVIRVSRKHISDGEARNCNTCAISQALWHNQERMGFPKSERRFEVSTYGAFIEPRGIVLRERWGQEIRRLPATELPEIAVCAIKGRAYSEGMAVWTMGWDEWAESRCMSLDEWREKHGYTDGERPLRPGPCSFVLDLDAMAEPAR
jgi:hypothetical protein